MSNCNSKKKTEEKKKKKCHTFMWYKYAFSCLQNKQKNKFIYLDTGVKNINFD